MTNSHQAFFDRCCFGLVGVAISDGAFQPGPAIWVGTREVAHFDRDGRLDLRLTKATIRSRRAELRADVRIALGSSGSDWVVVVVDPTADDTWAVDLVRDAITSNASTAPQGFPPTGKALQRRRRFH